MSQLPVNPAGGFGCNAAETQQSPFTAGGEWTHSQLDEKSVIHFVTAEKNVMLYTESHVCLLTQLFVVPAYIYLTSTPPTYDTGGGRTFKLHTGAQFLSTETLESFYFEVKQEMLSLL